MSAGQVTTALAFVVSGFVQLAIDNELTPIPDYLNQNSLMVINGYHQVVIFFEFFIADISYSLFYLYIFVG